MHHTTCAQGPAPPPCVTAFAALVRQGANKDSGNNMETAWRKKNKTKRCQQQIQKQTEDSLIRKTTEIRVRHVAYELPSSSSARDNAISKAKGWDDTFCNDGSLPVSTPVTPGGSQFGHNFRASRAQLFTSWGGEIKSIIWWLDDLMLAGSTGDDGEIRAMNSVIS